MKRLRTFITLACALCLSLAAHARCDGDIALQVLGSGGPIADDGRASSGYLLWIDGSARLLIDTGGGIFLRFGEADAHIEDLDAIVLTHLHTDHAAALPALLKSAYFSPRQRPLPLLGPSGAPRWPTTSAFVRDLIGSEHGAFRYLDGFLDGSDGFRLDTRDIDADSRVPQTVFDNGRFRIQAVGVEHGPVPALGLLIEVGGYKIALSGDQNDDNPAFAKMIQGADLLLMDHAIPQDAGPIARKLHPTPRGIGRLAADAQVEHLVLSHLMRRSLVTLDRNRAQIRERYKGRMSVAEDLVCYSLPDRIAAHAGDQNSPPAPRNSR